MNEAIVSVADFLKLPDWAPLDAGSILFRDGNWIIVKDYLFDDHSPVSTPVHLCGGRPWQPHQNPPTLYEGKCTQCEEKPPEAFLGFAAMVVWDK
jgi:hypothetical protein